MNGFLLPVMTLWKREVVRFALAEPRTERVEHTAGVLAPLGKRVSRFVSSTWRTGRHRVSGIFVPRHYCPRPSLHGDLFYNFYY